MIVVVLVWTTGHRVLGRMGGSGPDDGDRGFILRNSVFLVKLEPCDHRHMLCEPGFLFLHTG